MHDDKAQSAMVLPPWLVGSEAQEPLREAVSRARWLLASYWALLLSGYAVLFAVAALYWHGGATALATLGTLGLTSLVGTVAGNLVAMRRLKVWVIHVVVVLSIVGACLMAPVLGVATLWVVAFLWSVSGGFHALQRKFSLWSLWVPLICWTGAILTLVERTGMGRWQSGEKHSIWNPLAFGLLVVMVLFFFVFFAGQENYHLRVWQAGGNMGASRFETQALKSSLRLTGRGALALVFMALAVSGAVALVSPYLFRTRHESGSRDRQQRPSAEPREQPPRPPAFDADGLREAMRRALRRTREEAKEVLPFVPLFFLNRPLRRLFLMWRWRRRGQAPGARAQGLWRYVTLGLDDAQLGAKAGESLEEMVTRINTARAASGLAPVEGLAESASVYGRLRYGLGIPLGALDSLEQQSALAFRSVRESMSRWARLKSWWRQLH